MNDDQEYLDLNDNQIAICIQFGENAIFTKIPNSRYYRKKDYYTAQLCCANLSCTKKYYIDDDKQLFAPFGGGLTILKAKEEMIKFSCNFYQKYKKQEDVSAYQAKRIPILENANFIIVDPDWASKNLFKGKFKL